MRKFKLTFLILAGAFTVSFSQSQSLPELEKKLETLSGEEEIKALQMVSEGYLDYEPNKAVLYGEIALKKADASEISELLFRDILNTLAGAYFNSEKYIKALEYYEELLTIYRDSGTINELAVTEYNIASCHSKTGNLQEAEKYYKQSLADAEKANNNSLLSVNYRALYELKQNRRQYYEAAGYLESYVRLNEQLFNKKEQNTAWLKPETTVSDTNNIPAIAETAAVTDKQLDELRQYFRKELKNQEQKLQKAEAALHNAREATDRKVNILLTISTLGFIITLIWVAVIYRRKKAAQKILELQKHEIEKQADLLRDKNNKLKESIQYARRIQDSILRPQDEILKYLPQAFIYYQPKDIVSGDFYWFSKVEDELVLAAIDCTGHGVPGAFMSMIGFTLLNEIVNQRHITKPDRILKHLHLGVLAALQQTDNGTDDGMDMSLCTINPKLKRFQFAGAKNNLYVMQGDKLKVLKANHHSVGGRPIRMNKQAEFSSYDFMYDDKTSIYMMSDGYIDQFGGLENQKFNSDRFKQMLMENRGLPMPQQKVLMQQRFDEWRGDREQVDDILVMGVKLQ